MAKLNNLNSTPSLINQFVSELRSSSIQSDQLRFRTNLERIGEIIAYEISKTLDYTTDEVETSLGIANVDLTTDEVVLATILRAGIPMHHGMLRYFDKAENAFVTAYRKHHKDGTFEINLENISSPDLNGKILIICDPMIATGASLVKSLLALMEFGSPKQIHVATVIAATPGIEYLMRNLKEVTVWAAAVDDELTARSYIVPGLGDAGDLAFGEKLYD